MAPSTEKQEHVRRLLVRLFHDPGIDFPMPDPNLESDRAATLHLLDLMVEFEEMRPGHVR